MKKLPAALIILCFLSSCVKQEDFVFDGSIVYKPEFSIPLGKPELLMDEFMNTLNNLQSLPDSLVSDTTAFSYEDNYYDIPEILTNTYFEEFRLSMLEENTDQLVSLMFRSNITNGIPGRVIVQVYFADARMNYLDSLYHEGPLIIDAAEVDNDGNVINEFVIQVDSDFDQERIEDVSGTSYVIIYTSLVITNLDGIIAKYYASQDFTMQLGARVGLKIESE